LEIVDKNEWLNLREIRNEIAYEYNFNQDEVVENINLIYQKTDKLIDIYSTINDFIIDKFDIK